MIKGASRTSAASSEAEARHLYEVVASHVHRLAFMLTGDVGSADDLIQETFIKIYRRLRSLQDAEHLSTYIYRSILNTARKQQRSHGRRIGREDRARERVRPTGLPDVETRDELWSALLQLPLRQRAAIYLRYYEDLSEAQAASVLGCSVSALKSLTNRGLRTARTILDGRNDEARR